MPSYPSESWSRWHLPLLALAVLAIVVVPFLLLRQANSDNVQALAMVNHTREVENTIQALAYDVRNLEAATLGLVAGVRSPEIDQRIQESMRRIPGQLETLKQQTRDNPEQQVRLGALATTAAQRLESTRDILKMEDGAARRNAAASMVRRFPIRDITDAMLEEESGLLLERDNHAVSLQKRTLFVSWAAIIAQLLLLGTVTYFSQRQIRRRQLAETQAMRASARALAVLQSVQEPIALVDSRQCLVMHNAAFEDVYDSRSDEAVGKPLAEIGNGAWRHAEFQQRLKDVLTRDRELWDYEISQRNEDGSERIMLVNARRMPLPDRDDEVALLTASDITIHKTSERHIRELNHQLAGKVEQVSDVNRELEAFSYSVSHDLRAPLRHIAGFADKLGRQLGDDVDEKSKHYLDVISNSARRMSNLIDDLLVYSRLGRSAMRLQAVDIQSMVDETRAILDSNLQSETPDRHVQWNIARMPIIVADENMMRQVWLNLLGNAVKYSANRDPAVIEVSHHRDDEGNHLFSVADNGAGFDMQYAGKLFGVFQRMHRASDYPGTGIGLASVRRVVMRHGGTISADARPDEGATFTFTLPATLDQPVHTESPK